MWTIYFVYADVQYVRDAIYLGINKRLSLQVVWSIGLERISFSCLPRLKLTPFFFLRAKAALAYGHKKAQASHIIPRQVCNNLTTYYGLACA